MDRLKTVLSQPSHKRDVLIDSMYAAARQNKFDDEMAQEVIDVIEQVQGRHDFGPYAEKLRKQIADPKYPLKVVHYKVATTGPYDDRHCVDTFVCVKREEIEEIAAKLDPDCPQQMRPHVVANQLRIGFAEQIQAAVEAEPYVKKCNLGDWPIAEGPLEQAIKEIAKTA